MTIEPNKVYWMMVMLGLAGIIEPRSVFICLVLAGLTGYFLGIPPL